MLHLRNSSVHLRNSSESSQCVSSAELECCRRTFTDADRNHYAAQLMSKDAMIDVLRAQLVQRDAEIDLSLLQY